MILKDMLGAKKQNKNIILKNTKAMRTNGGGGNTGTGLLFSKEPKSKSYKIPIEWHEESCAQEILWKSNGSQAILHGRVE